MSRRRGERPEVEHARDLATRWREEDLASKVDHPSHYGGAGNPYEAIRVIEAWGLGFSLGNAVKYISRAGKKDGETELVDLEKAKWYLERRIAQLEGK